MNTSISKLLGLLLLLISTNLYAQTPERDFHFALKVSNLSSLLSRDVQTLNYDAREMGVVNLRSIDLFQLAPSILFQTKKLNFGELGLVRLNAQRHEIEDGIVRDGPLIGHEGAYRFAFRCGYFQRFFKHKTSPWMPMLGLEAVPYFDYMFLRPGTSSRFPTSDLSTGVQGWLSPRLAWMPKSRFFMDFTASVALLNWEIRQERHPRISNHTDVNFDLFDQQYYFQIGAGFKL